MHGQRVLVCGGRDYRHASRVYQVLDNIRPSEVCQGGASGADSYAASWCRVYDVPCKEYRANWAMGKVAGRIRNEHMLRDFQPDLVVAFPGGVGTAHMVAIARDAGVPVMMIGEPE